MRIPKDKRELIHRIDISLARFRNWFPTVVCRVLGGHKWYDWNPEASYNVLHERSVYYIHRCQTCGKREYFKAPNNQMEAREPNYFF